MVNRELLKNIYDKYADVSTKQDKGDYIITEINKYFNPQKIIIFSTGVKVAFPYVNVWVIYGVIAVSFFFVPFLKYLGGVALLKSGYWRRLNEFVSKKDHIAPFNRELQDQMVEIAKIVGADIKFKEL